MNDPAAVAPAVGRSPQHNLPHSDAGRPREPDATEAVASFVGTSEGLTNGRRRSVVAQLQGVAADQYMAQQMGYDLRWLARRGLVRRLHGKHGYTVTRSARRLALFLTKVHARVLRPGLQALDLAVTTHTPTPLRRASTGSSDFIPTRLP